MEDLKKEYRDLEIKVLSQLRDKVNKSKHKSKNFNTKVIKVDVEDYRELGIIDGELTFIDSRDLLYSVFTISLEELIDILEP